jgi:hypothetical protein
MTDCPPIVAVPVRLLEDVLGAAASDMLPAPVPLVGLTVSHAADDETLQAHPAGTDTFTEALPPFDAIETDVGDSDVVQGWPACVTEITWPPTVTDPVRATLDVFGAAAIVTVAPPVLETGDTVSHVFPELAVQTHPDAAETVRTCDPPAAAIDRLAGETPIVHGAGAAA